MWMEEDCLKPVLPVEPVVCKDECTYTDCSATADGKQCWVERCDDLCGNFNCSIWIKEDKEWYGDICPVEPKVNDEPWFRVQDILESARLTRTQYSGTIMALNDLLGPATGYKIPELDIDINNLAETYYNAAKSGNDFPMPDLKVDTYMVEQALANATT